MNKLEAIGRMIQWAIELSQFDIEYKPRVAIKAQALVDFIAEFTMPEDGKNQEETIQWTDHWYKRGGAGVVIITPEGNTLKYGVQLQFPVTNNEAVYEAMLIGLKVVKAWEPRLCC